MQEQKNEVSLRKENSAIKNPFKTHENLFQQK